MTLEEMGGLLRQAREHKGMTLEAAAAEMRISKRYLAAFEDGRTDHLPHPVYAKGFIKSYARLIGLDPEEMGGVLSYHYADEDDGDHHKVPGKGRGVSGPDAPGAERKSPKTGQTGESDTAALRNAVLVAGPYEPLSERRGFKPSLWLVIPLAVVFAGLLWFFFSSFGQNQANNPSGADTSKAPGMEAGQVVSPVSSSPPPEQAPSEAAAPGGGTQSGAAVPGVQTQGAAVPVQTAQAPASSAQAANPEKPASESQFAAAGKQILEINAKEPAALEVSTENGQTRSFTLVRGQRLSLRFNDRVSVRFGDARSVAVKVNGKDYPLGESVSGQSVTFP